MSILFFATACSDNMSITANPDNHTATSGTLGSAKHTNQLPPASRDSLGHIDTSRISQQQ